MPFNVLLLPLLGGYVFISYWNRTRFDARRYSGERLLLHSALAGVWFLLIAFVVTRSAILVGPATYSSWREIVPFEYTGTSFFAFILGATAWWPLNRIHDREEEALKAVEAWGDDLEMLLVRSLRKTEQLSISLASGKVYVGFVTSAVDASFDRKHMKLLPTVSGYRDPHTRELVITHEYAEVYEQLMEDDRAELIAHADDFQVVIPIGEIVTASRFDPDVYEMFQRTSAA